jgi:acetyl-CoA carboxylase biotin carboxylase subunit
MYFGKNGGMYIEKFIDQGRHIEVQVLADMHGHMIHLGERECSIQRRHQKLVEECPSPSIDEHLRSRLGRMAVRAAESGGYVGAGTVEFIVDAQGNFYFVEMNARIQVEHPITEMVTGVDILKELIKISAGQRLHYHQKDIEMRGHSIECRINAEDFANDFLPSPGEIKRYIQPGGPGIRVDSHIFTGYTVPHEYDSLVAKLIVHAEDRGASIARMKRALDEMYIEGIKTTIPLHKMIMDNMTFNNGLYSTGFIEELLSGKKEKSL